MLHRAESRSDLGPSPLRFNAGKWRPELSRVGRKAERQPAQVLSPRRMARLETGSMTLSQTGGLNGQTNTSPSFAAGIAVPDTKLAMEATELVRDTTTELIYHHSRRVYWFGSLQGRNRGLSFDPELLYIGAMFHDVGLGERFRTDGRRFEVDSADEARRFLQRHRVPEDSIRRVWTAIALHTTPGIPEFMEPEVPLVTAVGEYDAPGLPRAVVGDEEGAGISAAAAPRD